MKRSPNVALAALSALALCAGAASGSPRLVDFPRDLPHLSGPDLDQDRARRAALGPNAPEAKVESAVLERARALGQALAVRTTRPALDLAADFSSPGVPIDGQARLYLRIDGKGIAARVNELIGMGVEPAAVAGDYDFMEAWVPYNRVVDVASLSWVRLVGMAGIPASDLGAFQTQGDAIHRANLARSTFGIDGTGAKVGVISDGVVNLALAQGSSDLGAVQVNAIGSGDEGTAMLEIVHDLAPGATLAFSSGNGGSANMILSQNWLANTGLCNVIVDDLWFPREPYFEDGNVATNAANLVTLKDVVYFTSAGNRAQRHVQQNFVDGGVRAIGTAGNFRAHAFGANDYTLDLRLSNPSGTGVRHTIVLQWGEKFGTAAKNFDLYLLDGTLSNVLQSSTTVQNGAGDAVELIDFTYNGPDNAPAFLVVDFNSAGAAPANMPLKIAANGPRFLQYVNPAGSINPHAGHPLLMAIGAIDAADPGNDSPEAFSSRGPFQVLFPAPATRGKPDAMGIDDVSVSGVGGFPTPFSGTSAAAPHGAGIAALLRGVLPALTSQQVRDALKAGAVDLLAPGFDNSTGAGRLDAMLTIAPFLNQPPVAVAGNDTTVECGGALTNVKLDGSNSYDPDGDPLTYTWSAPGVTFDDAHAVTPTGGFPLGETSVLLAVYDGAVADSDTVVVKIEDTLPPKVTVVLDPATLWPPNHRLAEITATVTVDDSCDAAPVVRLKSITSDEPDDGLGDGDTADDIQGEAIGTNDLSFLLRSERGGGGDGRTYTVCYEAEDASGNVGTGCATVKVTHDQALLASFGATNAWDDGGYIELSGTAVDVRQIADANSELGGASFERAELATSTATVIDGTSAEPGAGGFVTVEPARTRVRWSVSAAQLHELLSGSGEPTVFLRLVAGDGRSWLATAAVPGVPSGALAPTGTLATAAARSEVAPVVESATARFEVKGGIVQAAGGIAYALPRDARMTLRLVSPTGRVLARLVDGDAAAGWHTAPLPRGLAPGLYFRDARMEDTRVTAKVLITR
jgi:hypothetical protein